LATASRTLAAASHILVVPNRTPRRGNMILVMGKSKHDFYETVGKQYVVSDKIEKIKKAPWYGIEQRDLDTLSI
jgi:hypothetical protein